MLLPGKERILSVLNNRMTQVITVVFILYFLMMDIHFYEVVQKMKPITPTGVNVTLKPTVFTSPFSPFSGFSIKMMMIDHLCHYITTPIAHIFSTITHLSSGYWITPNLISFCGILFALVAGVCVSYDRYELHLIAVCLMFFRSILDGLDGIVARERLGEVHFVSLRNTTGYAMDAIADILGFTVFLVGCLIYVRKNFQKHYMVLPNAKSTKMGVGQSARLLRKLTVSVFLFGFQIALSSAFWDRFCDKYHGLLITPRPLYSQSILQNKVLKSNLFWVTAWIWRITNGQALMNLLLGVVFVKKMPEFFLWIRYIGYIAIFALIVFTEVHFRDVETYINGVN